MAKQRRKTTKTKFESPNTEKGPVTAAQRIAEMMCERAAKKDGESLPVEFWNDAIWKKFWMLQLLTVNKLLKKYPSEVIFAVLRSKEGGRIYSLRAPQLKKMLEREMVSHARVERLAEECVGIPEDPTEGTAGQAPRQSIRKPDSLSKLRELDGED